MSSGLESCGRSTNDPEFRIQNSEFRTIRGRSVTLGILRVPGWERFPGLVHGFLGRRGGVSCGEYASLNLSAQVNDTPEAVARNWDLVGRVTGLRLVRMRQVHGNHVVRVLGPTQVVGDADGMYTSVSGLGLTVLSADCVPVLMVDPRVRAVAAVHAGWRGTLAGVVPTMVEALSREFGTDPADMHVALGPAIAACCYVVQREIGDGLTSRWGAMPEAWSPEGSHGRLDLRAANGAMLVRMGIPKDRIEVIGSCTSCHFEGYFSHRRSGGLTGRQGSFIGWKDDSPVVPMDTPLVE